MLKCREIVEHADALLATELSPGRRMAVRVHLLMCRHCRRYVRQLQDLLRAVPQMHGRASDAEVAKVVRAVREHDKDA
ncbi:zf-HC2 domain-containing protein [Litorivivens sp.]|uniref:anti-sigma factor family protein n=1 Tax=Litorivivens sp. TaxID=2020868 RepID=UPI003561D8C0